MTGGASRPPMLTRASARRTTVVRCPPALFGRAPKPAGRSKGSPGVRPFDDGFYTPGRWQRDSRRRTPGTPTPRTSLWSRRRRGVRGEGSTRRPRRYRGRPRGQPTGTTHVPHAGYGRWLTSPGRRYRRRSLLEAGDDVVGERGEGRGVVVVADRMQAAVGAEGLDERSQAHGRDRRD